MSVSDIPEAKHRVKTVWDVGLQDGIVDLQSVRILDFFAFACLPLTMIDVGGLGPINAAAALCLAGACLLRRPPTALRTPLWVVVLLGLFMTYLFANSLLLDVVNTKRMIRLVAWALIIVFLATGHIDIRSAAKGLAASMTVAVIHGLITFNQSSYAGRLTGVLGDPNTAGMECLVFGCLGVMGISRRRWKYLYIATMSVGVLMVFSRTTLVALVAVLLWTFIGRRLGWVLGYAMLAVLTVAITSIPHKSSIFGPFEGRSGSDALRERIDAAATALVEQSPLRGHGLGTAMVELQNQLFFFHNSFVAMACEGGWIAVVLFMLLAGVVFTALLRLPKAARNPWVEAAFVGSFICGLSLGEVLLTFGMASTLGFALRTFLLSDPAILAAAGAKSDPALVGNQLERLQAAAAGAGTAP